MIFTYLLLKTNNDKPLKLDVIHIFLQVFIEKSSFNVHVNNVPIIISCKSHHVINSASFYNYSKSLFIVIVYLLFKT